MALAKGSTGANVYTLQMQLNKFGYGLQPDSMFGPATDAAVRDFQRQHNLPVTGVVDDVMAEALSQGILRMSQQVQVVSPQPVAQPSGTVSPLPAVLFQSGVTGFKVWQEVAVVVGLVGLWVMMKD